ncbi:MAG: GTP cyclohydrolase II [Candidatus Cloacimonadota bacterium]|nr:GTP cyclohydrolase II [Candidatus Cloacimonadota bacterium]
MKLNSIEETIDEIKQGKVIIVVDDENRENEGDLVCAADKITPAIINFMISKGKGLVCVPMKEKDLERLKLNQMVKNNSDPHCTAFTISVDYKASKTGISASERAITIQNLANPKSQSCDFVSPGHIFPLKAKTGGILERAGHTEASIEIVELAGFSPVAVICEIIKDDGEMARLPDLYEFAKKWNLKIISIEDLQRYKKKSGIKREIEINLPTKFGDFNLIAFSDDKNLEPHLALIKGDVAKANKPILTRIHSECLTGDLLGSQKCDCGDQLGESLDRIEKEGLGVVLYLRQEGRGIGLLNKLKAYKLQEDGADTVDANLLLGFEPELRDYKVAADILKDLGIYHVDLMTNNPLKIQGLEENEIEVKNRISIEIEKNKFNYEYLNTKKLRMGHLIN